MTSIPLQSASTLLSPFRSLWTWMSNLMSQGGHLLSYNGNLLGDTNGCNCCNGSSGGGGCPCADLAHPCSFCPDATPTQYHITFTGVALCTGCVNCDSTGTSLELSGSINGTFVLTENGTCGWSVAPGDVPVTATFYTTGGCSGSSVPAQFGIDQIRISSTQFQLQIVDSTETVYFFRATIDLTTCCNGYTAANELTDCGCVGGASFITAGTGGTATVTPC